MSIFNIEKAALTSISDRKPVIWLVSNFRKLRQAVHIALDRRYSDGECDSCTLFQLQTALQEIEEAEDWEG